MWLFIFINNFMFVVGMAICGTAGIVPYIGDLMIHVCCRDLEIFISENHRHSRWLLIYKISKRFEAEAGL